MYSSSFFSTTVQKVGSPRHVLVSRDEISELVMEMKTRLTEDKNHPCRSGGVAMVTRWNMATLRRACVPS